MFESSFKYSFGKILLSLQYTVKILIFCKVLLKLLGCYHYKIVKIKLFKNSQKIFPKNKFPGIFNH